MKRIEFEFLNDCPYSFLDHVKGIFTGRKYWGFFNKDLKISIGITYYDGYWFYLNLYIINFCVNY